MVGSLPNLYSSIENLNDSYIQPNQTKNTLLKPVSPVTGYSCVPLLATKDTHNHAKKFYRCNISCVRGGPINYVSDDPNAVCPKCGQIMSLLMQYVGPPHLQEVCGDEGGFVKGVVTYLVTDDLAVMPLSTVSSFTLLEKFDVKDLGALEEKVVNLGMFEAVKLLKASLETKNVLTHVFLKDLGNSTMCNEQAETEEVTVSEKTINWFEPTHNLVFQFGQTTSTSSHEARKTSTARRIANRIIRRSYRTRKRC